MYTYHRNLFYVFCILHNTENKRDIKHKHKRTRETRGNLEQSFARELLGNGLKTTFGGRGPSVEEDLLWKTTFGGRRPSVEDDL